MRRHSSSRHSLHKKARKGFRGFPAATIAFYGPDNTRASKVVVGIFLEEGGDPAELTRLFSEEDDVRYEPSIQKQIQSLLKTHGVRSVAVTDGIIGCPHEEGIDYPEGKSCPKCPYWARRNRFTGERIQ
jgi:hypothetical protein